MQQQTPSPSDMTKDKKEQPQQPLAEDPAAARKRRIERRAAGQKPDGEELPSKRPRTTAPPEEDGPERKKPSIRGIKKQARYVPGVEMSKEELTQWRKEARRVRNRESAAASRRKTRERIDELETEVAELKSKYAAALQTIAELQSSSTNDSFTPDKLRQDLVSVSVVSPAPSVAGSPQQAPAVSPLLSPQSSTDSLFQLSPSAMMESTTHEHADRSSPLSSSSSLSSSFPQEQPSVDIISRPTAAKIINDGAIAHNDNNKDDVNNDPEACDWYKLPPTFVSLEYNQELDLAATATMDSEESCLGGSSSGSDTTEVGDEEDRELGEFLWDAFAGFDPQVEDLADLCA